MIRWDRVACSHCDVVRGDWTAGPGAKIHWNRSRNGAWTRKLMIYSDTKTTNVKALML